jgi:hypothetical protein
MQPHAKRTRRLRARLLREVYVYFDRDSRRKWLSYSLQRTYSKFYVDLNRDHRNPIFLAGTARSGTTWASDIINYKNEYRYAFEPFHSGKVEICKGFQHRQYLKPEDRREEFLRPARTILSGGQRSRRPDHLHRRFMKQPSLFSRPESAVLSGERLVGGWRKHVTDAQLQRAVEILGLFELDKIYSEEAMPDPCGALTLMGTGR